MLVFPLICYCGNGRVIIGVIFPCRLVPKKLGEDVWIQRSSPSLATIHARALSLVLWPLILRKGFISNFHKGTAQGDPTTCISVANDKVAHSRVHSTSIHLFILGLSLWLCRTLNANPKAAARFRVSVEAAVLTTGQQGSIERIRTS